MCQSYQCTMVYKLLTKSWKCYEHEKIMLTICCKLVVWRLAFEEFIEVTKCLFQMVKSVLMNAKGCLGDDEKWK